jgi:ATP-dependent protease Clp ATPase subunit
MFTLDHSKLVFTDDALDAIAELAIKKRTGKFFGVFSACYRNSIVVCI